MINYRDIIFDTFSCDVWQTLLSSSKPILIYGMGNGADKIISVMERYGISYQDVFASDGFVRGHSYRGKTVLSYSQAVSKYGDFDIVVSFGSKLPDVIDRIYSLEKMHNVYAPDVPVVDGELFCEEFFSKNCDKLFRARESFSDEKSKQVFDDIIRFKLTARLEYLRKTSFSENEEGKILSYDKYQSYLDLGAYNGDTAKKYSTLCKNLNKIYALEPDKRNFKKLCAFLDTLNISSEPINSAAYSTDTELCFSASGNRNSTATKAGSFEHKVTTVNALKPDSVVDSVDFIKYDIEGLEYEGLLGSKRLLQECMPDLLVSMYHKSEDMFELPLLIKEINPNYRLFLRRLPYIPAWDLNLYAIK